MGLFGGGGNQARRASEEAAKAVGFAPEALDVAGVGAVGVSPTGAVTTTLPGELRAIQQNLFGAAPAALGAAGGLVDPAAAGAERLFGAGGRALEALGTFDPLQAAQQQFESLESILNPLRERETAGLEARLARQGILTGTAGERRLGERAAAIERERQLALLNQFQAAGQEQSRLANLGIGLTGAGQDISDRLFGRGVQATQAGQQISAPLLNLLGLSTDIGQARTAGQIARANALTSFNQQQAAAGGGGLGDILGGAAGGLIGSLAGPVGTAVGARIGGGLFGGGAANDGLFGSAAGTIIPGVPG